jgi:hypothetical protein
MPTLLRLPIFPVSGLANGLDFAFVRMPFVCAQREGQVRACQCRLKYWNSCHVSKITTASIVVMKSRNSEYVKLKR